MKDKTQKEDKTSLEIKRYFLKSLKFFVVKSLFLWKKTLNVRKRLKAFFENETTKSIIQFLLLSGTIAVLLVANKQRKIANEQQEITIKLQNIANKQLLIAEERQQWLREDRERIADVYLETTSVTRIDPDTLKLTFCLVNKGNDNARDGRLLFYIVDSLSPHISHTTDFQSRPGEKGFVASVEDMTPEGTIYHSIKSDDTDYSAKLSLVLSLKLTPQLKREEEIDDVTYIFCFHCGCQKSRILPFSNPFFGEE